MAKDKEEKKIEEEIKNKWFNCGKDECCSGCCGKHKKVKVSGGCNGAIYGFGLIGALFYFFGHLGPATFGNVIMAIVKSIAWPALFVYKILLLWKF